MGQSRGNSTWPARARRLLGWRGITTVSVLMLAVAAIVPVRTNDGNRTSSADVWLVLTLAVLLTVLFYVLLSLGLQLAGMDGDAPQIAQHLAADPDQQRLLQRWLERARWARFVGGFAGVVAWFFGTQTERRRSRVRLRRHRRRSRARGTAPHPPTVRPANCPHRGARGERLPHAPRRSPNDRRGSRRGRCCDHRGVGQRHPVGHVVGIRCTPGPRRRPARTAACRDAGTTCRVRQAHPRRRPGSANSRSAEASPGLPRSSRSPSWPEPASLSTRPSANSPRCSGLRRGCARSCCGGTTAGSVSTS